MCKCSPGIKTPFCGRPGCEWPKQTDPQVGWAIIDGNRINLRTVSDTRRAAIVNWLVTERNVQIYNAMTDDHIEGIWFQFRGTAEAQYVNVTPALQ